MRRLRGSNLLGSDLARVASAIRAGLTSPESFSYGLRRGGAAILDAEFDRMSRIPDLPAGLLHAVYRHEVVVPPPSVLLGGNQSIEGLIFLASLARSLDAKQCFEVGTYNGVTAWCLARNVEGGVIHTLDLPSNNEAALPLGNLDSRNRRSFLTPVYSMLPHRGEVIQHWDDSARFDFDPFRGSCDLVYVDGAHSQEYVESDTRNALRIVSPYGAIVWDDYWRRVPDVRSVLDEIDNLDLYRVPQTRLVMHLTAGARSRLAESRVVLRQPPTWNGP
jgi:predicted O-methyltransferase YrrM